MNMESDRVSTESYECIEISHKVQNDPSLFNANMLQANSHRSRKSLSDLKHRQCFKSAAVFVS